MSRPLRVAGADPGTGSLDLLILEDGVVLDQVRFAPTALSADPGVPVRWLQARGPFARVAAPSGYGVPLVAAADLTPTQLEEMALVRPDERGQAQGVAGFTALLQTFRDSGLPAVFLPGVIHLPTVPPHRKYNRIDLGTADKLCVAALAQSLIPCKSFALVELGSAFTACLVVADGQVVDGVGGSSGPPGWQACGAWDGEVAYLLSPLRKADLFRGGAGDLPPEEAVRWLGESLRKTLAGLGAVTPFERILVSGRLPATEPGLVARLLDFLRDLAPLEWLPSLPDAWVKHAAQGAAVIADGLAGGRHASLVAQLQLREASGSVTGWLRGRKPGESIDG